MTGTEQPALDDAALIERARKGDGAALEALLERHARRAFSVAAAVLRHREDALDATQVVLMELACEVTSRQWRSTNLLNYVYRRAHAAAVDLLRQKLARCRREQSVAAQAVLKDVPTLSERAQDEEMLGIMREEMAALDDETAAALAMFHLEGLSVGEVAEAAGVSVDACKQRLVRGREKLRERLERRGVLVGSLALVECLLGDVCNASRLLCTQVEQARFAKLSQGVASEVLKQIAIANTPSVSAQKAAGAGAQPEHRSGVMRTTIVVAAGLMLVLAVALVITAGSEKNSHTSRQAPQPKSDKSVPSPLAAAPASVARELKWRGPFSLGKGAALSISTKGAHVSLLVRDSARQLRRVFSNDTGASWKSHEVAGVEMWQPDIVQFSDSAAIFARLADKHLQPTMELHWRQFGLDGGTIISSGSRQFSIRDDMAFARHVATEAGVWAFIPGDGMAAGFSPDVRIPAELTSVKCSRERTPIVWAADGSTAGYVSCERDPGLKPSGGPDYAGWKAYHYRTVDGGKTWPKFEIPLMTLTGSETKRLFASPVDICRSGEFICVLLMRRVPISGTPNNADDTLHACMSSDLGATWSEMVQVSCGGPAELSNSQSPPKIHIVGAHMFAVYCRWASVAEPVQPVVRTSTDNGATWSDVQVLNADARGCISASDETALYIATYDMNGAIRIYTFSNQDAVAPAAPGNPSF